MKSSENEENQEEANELKVSPENNIEGMEESRNKKENEINNFNKNK